MAAIGEKLSRFIMRRIVPLLLGLLGKSIRFRVLNEGFIARRGMRGEGCIYAFWHNRILLMPYLYDRVRFGKNMCAMASASRDGEYISDVLKGFGFAVARGSSSRQGSAALMEMAELTAAGMDASVVPDGPRGPRYHAQPGVVYLAQITGLPLVPATCDFTRKKRIRSWDRFLMPLPFCRGVLVLGEPIFVPKDAGDEERERLRAELETRLMALNAAAAEYLGVEKD